MNSIYHSGGYGCAFNVVYWSVGNNIAKSTNMLKFKQRNYPPVKPLYLVALCLIVVFFGFAAYQMFNKKPVSIGSSVISNVGTNGTKKVNGKEVSSNDSLRFRAQQNQTIEYRSDEIQVNTKTNAAVLSWKQDGDDGVQLETRTKNDGIWSDWVDIKAEEPGKDGEKSDLSTALILAKNIDDIQYRVKLTGSQSKPSSEIDLSSSKIVTIDSSQGPDGNDTILGSLSSFLLPTARAIDSPNIISRSQWGSPEPNSSSWPPEYSKLGRVILHHTATTESGNSFADVRAIWQYHARTLGWGDIGYHYIVDSKGRIFQGRYYDQNYTRKNKVEVIGGHAYGNNVGTVGVSMIGNYQAQQPTSAALESMAQITGYKLAPYNINPSGNGPFGEAVIGHYRVYATECPGTNLINKFGSIKSRASQYFKHYAANLGFDPMLKPRWMRLANDTTKFNVDTAQPVDGVLPKDTDIKFVDKYDDDDTAYLRTQHDYSNSNRKGILFSDLAEITPEILPEATWMTVLQDTYKVDPRTESIDYSYKIPKGANVSFSEKIVVNNATYYKTSRDSSIGNDMYIKAIRLKDTTYDPFLYPRYLEVSSDINKQNPFTGQTSSEVLPAGIYKFTSKVMTDKVYFQTEADANNNSALSIPAEAAKVVEPVDIAPRWMALSKVTRKLDISTLTPNGQTLNKENYTSIKFTQKITVGSQVYYRTAYDATRSNPLVFSGSDLMEVPYAPMLIPRDMTTRYDRTEIIDPRTGQVLETLNGKITQKYSSKIEIGGIAYLRSSVDTNADISRAIRLDHLK